MSAQELPAAIALEVLLGIVLAAGMWGAGLACLALLRPEPLAPEDPLDAYPVGLLVLTAAAAGALLGTATGFVALLILAALGLALMRRYAVLASAIRAGAASLVAALPALVGIGAVFGVMLHGPGRDLDSNAGEEMIFYAVRLVSASQSIFPFRDLLAAGQRIVPLETAPTFLGAPLHHLPFFDPILFQATAMPVFLAASLAIGIGLAPARLRERAWLPMLLALGAIAYPTWMTETPPVALALPLAFSIYGRRRCPRSDRSAALVYFVGAVDLLLTKVVGLLVLAAFAAPDAARRVPAHRSRRAAVLLVGSLLAAGTVALVVFAAAGSYFQIASARFLPADAARGVLDQFSRVDTRALSPAVLVSGQILLVAGLVRRRSFDLAAAVATTALASWFVAGFGFEIAVGIAVLATALVLRDEGLERGVVLVGAGAGLLVAASWLREVYGLRAGLLGVVLFGAALVAADRSFTAKRYALGAATLGVLFALAGRPVIGVVVIGVLALAPLVRAPRAGVFGSLALLTAVVVGLSAAKGSLDVVGTRYLTIRREDYDVWRRVKQVVPRSGLVFTSQTGLPIDERHGWNNYPAIAGRQLYVAGWYDGRLRMEPHERDRRLAVNAQVLDGRIPPGRGRLTRGFTSYFAVLWRNEHAPRTFHLLYENPSFVLYRIR